MNKKQGLFLSVSSLLAYLLFAWVLTLTGEYTFVETLGMVGIGCGIVAIIVVVAFGCISIYEQLA